MHTGYLPLLTLSVLRNNDAVVSAGRAPLRQRQWSVGRASLHRRTSKRWLYWACPTQCNELMLVK